MTASSTKVPRYAPDAALMAVAAIWGYTFVSVKDSLTETTPFMFLALRFWLAFAVFGAVVPAARRLADKRLLVAGPLAGALFFAGYAFQTIGLDITSAAHAGFITGLFVVFTPILAAVVLRRPPHAGAMVGVALATTGLVLLTGGSTGRVSEGDLWVLGCAVAFAAHIVVLSRYAPEVHWAPLAWVQMSVVAVGSTVGALLVEPVVVPTSGAVWWSVALTAVAATAVALTVQTWAQGHIGPTRTALILILEPVFAGLFAFLLAGERLGPAGWAGSALIVSGMLASEITRLVADARDKGSAPAAGA